MFEGGICAGEGKAVDGGVGVAHQVDGIVERGFAALIDGFAEKQNGAAIAGRLLAELIDGERDGVENGGAAVPFFEIGDSAGGLVGDRREGLDQVWSAVEADDGDAVFDVADDGVHDGVESEVVIEVARACAAGFDNDGESERLSVGVVFDGYRLWRAVIGESEIFGVQSEYNVAVAASDEDRDHDEVRADGEFDLRVGLLSKRDRSDTQEKSQS